MNDGYEIKKGWFEYNFKKEEYRKTESPFRPDKYVLN